MHQNEYRIYILKLRMTMITNKITNPLFFSYSNTTICEGVDKSYGTLNSSQ